MNENRQNLQLLPSQQSNSATNLYLFRKKKKIYNVFISFPYLIANLLKVDKLFKHDYSNSSFSRTATVHRICNTQRWDSPTLRRKQISINMQSFNSVT